MATLTVQLPDFLTTYHGEVRLAGHRIGLFDLVARYNDGYSAEMLALYFPTLSLALVHKVIAFYLEHRKAVDEYVADCDRELTELEAQHPTQVTLHMLRERPAKMQAAEHAVADAG